LVVFQERGVSRFVIDDINIEIASLFKAFNKPLKCLNPVEIVDYYRDFAVIDSFGGNRVSTRRSNDARTW
jgi:hypothetical protein